MASTYLSKAGGTAEDRRIFTISMWVKKTKEGNDQHLYETYNTGNAVNDRFTIQFSSSDALQVINKNSGNTDCNKTTNRLFRDTSAWYHIVVAINTKLATASERVRVYVNGVEETSFSTDSPFPQNEYPQSQGTSYPTHIGRYNQGSNYFEGLMSHIHFIDGQQYAPTVFGETDSTTGEWKIKTNVSVNYGTNGFFILKDGNSVTDQSGNSNNFTVAGGTLTKSEDCPSNIFATLNPLDIGYTSNLSLTNGNNTTNQTSSWGDYGIRSTLAATTGKYYWEAKIATANTLCILPMETRLVINLSDGSPADDLYGVQRYSDSSTNIYDDGTFSSQNTAMWGGITSSDIISFALDLDNGKLFLAKNGAYKNQSGATGDPANGTNPTFTISDTTKTYGFYTEMRGNDNNGTIMNFGNGYFGTTAVSSAGTNASGIGIFEYDVPTGYTALSTKGLNE